MPGEQPRYPRREEENQHLCCILTRNKPAVFTDVDSVHPLIPFEFSHYTERMTICIHAMREQGLFLEFDVFNVEPFVINALRRALLAEVPSMAPAEIRMQQNSTILSDDMIGHRVGMVPFRADPRCFKFRPADKKPDSLDYGILFELQVEPKKVARSTRHVPVNPKVDMVKLYSTDFKFPRESSYPQDLMEKVGPVHNTVEDRILVATLHPAQELEFRVFVAKGIGKDHAKFSPVSTAFYRAKPEIRLLRDVNGEEAHRLRECFVNNKGDKAIIEVVKDQSGRESAVVKNDRLYTGCRKVLCDSTLSDAVKIGFRKNEFIFEVESVGALPSTVLVKEALTILKNRCEYHLLKLARFRAPIPSVVKMEEHS
ncbi:DNA-directed RNA polymerases I and III subunit RPAC1-like [Paramacrobiotus metropolitanus]|uniref:DNA-directed RNA polymerases I and III subunit RPAC1-like n=1 Tax=Paramacrobiotus metropolitanus TaxID=2943436 RepID=UPI0024457F5B|nr:DNA-directed RNA polymerases I and III subunit RPAC1-like [Paramacrobiotus metropolitanus]